MPEGYQSALDSYTELENYQPAQRLILFATALQFQISDLILLATDALTDGPDDKKCDLVYTDIDNGYAVIAQGYCAEDETRPSAPANKASDLNTGISWLLNRDLEDLPENLRSAADQLITALRNEQIDTLYLWYVHNLPESENVAQELATVQATAASGLARFHQQSEINIIVKEIGRNTLEMLYKSLEAPIIVNDTIKVSVSDRYYISSTDWTAVATTVKLSWLKGLFQKYKMDLFSANVRGYLGSRKSDRNINNGIKNTAENDPAYFWIFNNGLTILVHDFEPTGGSGECELALNGISIVNGAQTTGAIGNTTSPLSESGAVPVRFVKSNNQDTIKRIIIFNNSQNLHEAPDFRSNDPIQNRLRNEFGRIPDCTYFGGRRGSEEDIIRRPPNLIPSDTAAQSLVAFHQDPITAYNNKSEIWKFDSTYYKYFTEATTAKHILFCYGLLRTIEAKKNALISKKETSGLTEIEEGLLDFLRRRGGPFLLLSAIAKCMETFLNNPIPNRFSLSFPEGYSPQRVIDKWDPIVDVISAFISQLSPAIGFGLKRSSEIAGALSNFQSIVEATKAANRVIYEEFATEVGA